MRLASARPALAVTMTTAVLLLGGAGAGAEPRARSASQPALDEGVVAVVDGIEVPASLYRMYLRNGIQELVGDLDADESRRQVARLKRAILDELVDRALVQAEARRRGLTIAQDEVERRHRRWVDTIGGEPAYRAYLQEHAITDAEFRTLAVQEAAADRLLAAFAVEVTIAESDVRRAYEEGVRDPSQGARFEEPERVAAAHVLIAARPSLIARELAARDGLAGTALEAAVDEELRRRRDRAEMIRGEALAGADFAALARRWSDDPVSKRAGGDLGVFEMGTHVAAFDRAVFALDVGAIGAVVQTEYGFHVIRKTGHHPRRLRTFDELRDDIHRQLAGARVAAHLRSWLETRRRIASIAVHPEYAHAAVGAAAQEAARGAVHDTRGAGRRH